jgi:chromosome segregation ATPase
MSNFTRLISKLNEIAETLDDESSKVIKWAALTIIEQNDALEDTRAELADEESERLRLENALYEAQQAIETALSAVTYVQNKPVEFSKDMSGHINLMAGHGDPDYLTKGGNSIRHVDLREKKPRKSKSAQPLPPVA